MFKMCRVMVTGAGSGVGQGILKALRSSELPTTLIGADISPLNAALYRTDEAVIIPKVENPGAFDGIAKILKECQIDVLMIGSEFELEFFSHHKFRLEMLTGTKIIVSNFDVVEISNDKWLTAEFLRKNNLPYPKSYLPSSVEDAVSMSADLGFPFVIKSRTGTSSRNVHVVDNFEDLRAVFNSIPSPMLQELIASPSNELDVEYTCSLFKGARGEVIGPFIARRTLKGGTSWLIEVTDNPILHRTLLDLSSALDYSGSVNVQLMLRGSEVVPFELNARFSGTTAIRAHFGFNEPKMALLSYFYGKPIGAANIRKGVALRYNEEVFIENTSSDECHPGIHRGVVNRWF